MAPTSLSSQATIAFIGLGAMGAHSARNLVRAGYAVRGFDVRAQATQQLAADGGHAAASPADAATSAQFAVLFVVNAKQADGALFGSDGIAEHAAPGLIVISCVTMAPVDAKRLGELCAARGLQFVDAPVSGGTVGAEAGSLTIMASAPPATLDACRAVLKAMGSRLIEVGDFPGQGSTFKTINQLLCGVHLAVAGEALAMAEHAGIDPARAFELVSNSAAASWMLGNRGPRMLGKQYDDAKSAVDIFVKDLGLVMDLARETRFPAPLAAAALQSFLGASALGHGRLDDSAVIEFYRKFNPKT